MAEQSMDVVGSLRKVARELDEIAKEVIVSETADRITGAAWLIDYIAEGLDRELVNGAIRAQKLQRRQLGMTE